MDPIEALPSCPDLVGILCDVDDTLTWEGELVPSAFLALHAARSAGLRVVPVTGRPAGWVDHLARMWPVDGVVGENGGLWFWTADGRMHRRFAQDAPTRRANRARLDALGASILAAVPGTALASDQPYRELDVAVDFSEDVPRLPESAIDRVVALFEAGGATCKVSSIHVNGWFGAFDKLEGCRRFCLDRYGEALDPARWAFFGDSANDEPMFAAFPLSIGVANVQDFLPRMKAWPRYVTPSPGGEGFAEGVAALLARRGGQGRIRGSSFRGRSG
ncbi:MAG: HAD-IIB family hydrolase [Deltaproteobacteria bacterium]|nr:HAD-IIB family hydrolase [Deltaproteobacteria bacterium]